MNVTIKQLPKSQVELTISVAPEQQQPHLVAAAKKISENTNMPGFRPGLAPYDVVVAHVGEMKIMENALEAIVRETFVEAVRGHELRTVGMPEINIEKMAPHNELVYRATVSVVPTVTLPDFSKISIPVKPVAVEDAEVDRMVADLQNMHAASVETTDAADKNSRVTVDMDLFDGAVPLEGGQARGHIVEMNEAYYIPGFVDKLVGVHAGDELSFELPFPKDYSQKLYAGKNVTFKIGVRKIERRELPAVDEDFAKKLGVESVTVLRENIARNLADEHKNKAAEVADIEMMKAVIAQTNFGELPENLIDAERRKLMQDLMQSLQRHGITPEQYLADMKKSPEELEAGFGEQAAERAKMGLVTHTIAMTHNIDVTKAELETELNAIKDAYKNNEDAIKRLQLPEIQESVLNSLRNRKVMEWMREKMIKE